MGEVGHRMVRFHAELRHRRGAPDAVIYRRGVLTGYGLEALLDGSHGADRIDLALEDEPEPEMLAWLQERLRRARARGIQVLVARERSCSEGRWRDRVSLVLPSAAAGGQDPRRRSARSQGRRQMSGASTWPTRW